MSGSTGGQGLATSTNRGERCPRRRGIRAIPAAGLGQISPEGCQDGAEAAGVTRRQVVHDRTFAGGLRGIALSHGVHTVIFPRGDCTSQAPGVAARATWCDQQPVGLGRAR